MSSIGSETSVPPISVCGTEVPLPNKNGTDTLVSDREWRECKLGEVVDYIAREISPKYSESDGTIVINQKCIRDGKINYEFTKVNDFSKKISDEKFLKQYDTLVNSPGVGTLGRVGLYDLENTICTADSHVMIVRASKNIDKKWFFYNLFSRQDEFNFTMGLSPKGETFNEEKIGIPMYQGNADFEFRFPKNRVYTTGPKRYAEKFDTLISVRAPVGAQNMAKEKCCIGRGVAAFKYKEDSSFYTYTYFKMKSLMDEIKQFNDSGTVFGSINKTDFEAMDVTIPHYSEVARFQNEVKPLDDKVIQNTFQIKTLENTRDTLLPKLMNGEVRVKI